MVCRGVLWVTGRDRCGCWAGLCRCRVWSSGVDGVRVKDMAVALQRAGKWHPISADRNDIVCTISITRAKSLVTDHKQPWEITSRHEIRKFKAFTYMYKHITNVTLRVYGAMSPRQPGLLLLSEVADYWRSYQAATQCRSRYHPDTKTVQPAALRSQYYKKRETIGSFYSIFYT